MRPLQHPTAQRGGFFSKRITLTVELDAPSVVATVVQRRQDVLDVDHRVGDPLILFFQIPAVLFFMDPVRLKFDLVGKTLVFADVLQPVPQGRFTTGNKRRQLLPSKVQQ